MWLPDTRVLLAVALVLAAASPALAHRVGLSRGEYAAHDGSVEATISLARAEALVAAPSLDTDGDGLLSDPELTATGATLAAAVTTPIGVVGQDGPCALLRASAAPAMADGATITATWKCGDGARSANMTLGFVDALPRGHRHMARVGETETVVWTSQPTVEVPLVGAALTPAPPGFTSMVLLGVEHILTGADHLLFLLALLLVTMSLRGLVGVVTSFTVAHSITLAAATLGLVAPSPSLVEPVIALSIVYVGLENRLSSAAGRRHAITFVFGLVHGLGFAGALQELALAPDAVPLALLGFNLGVEAGQLAVVALVLPAVVLARRATWLPQRLAPALSLGVAAVGLFWFVERVA